MRRIAMIGSMFLMMVAVVVSTERFGAAQDNAAGNDGTALVGTWRVMVTQADGIGYPVMSTFMADGTAIHDGLPAQPAVPGAPYKVSIGGTGHGVWEATGEGSSAITFELLNSDENGNYLGRLTVSGTQELSADGESFTGQFVITITDPAGAVIAAIPTTAVATKMHLEQPALPGSPEAGTPAA
ncbi:MAG: hypothetical protein QOF01_1917 [Thermomicrobiales bacterium]|nr:hypothetical protein [Thermomicrobiales bacterium]